MKKRRKVLLSAAAGAVLVLIVAAVIFFWFTPTGYRMSVGIHGFTQISRKVFVDDKRAKNEQWNQGMIEDARDRVKIYFGELKSDPTIIICDDEKKAKRLGGDHDTISVMLKGAHSYISLSGEWVNVNILAHEMTHAEVHARIVGKRSLISIPVPTWFDEGLAIQNDYREQYSHETWLAITENGENIPPIQEKDTAEKFYSKDPNERRENYCLAGNEVASWVSQNGKDKLFEMLGEIGEGEEFARLYSDGR